MGNVIIEDDVVIGANSVVTRSIPAGSIVGGIPAKIIGHTSDLSYSLFGNISDVEEKDGFAPFMEKKHKN